MNGTQAIPDNSGFSAYKFSVWLPVIVGLALVFVPTYWGLAGSLWQQDDYAHGPIILLIVAWLFWKSRQALLQAPIKPTPTIGFLGLLFGIALYVVGRSQQLVVFEVFAHVLIVTAVLLLMHGMGAVRAAWFPLLYMVFLIPIPGVIVDIVTAPLKNWISTITESTLYAAGYPIARNGVVLTIGQYQMLVADACSGIHSMFSLSALGLLFMHLMARKSLSHNLIMLVSILPIAFVANVIRVMILVLITYHFGDEAGQGFLHGTAGIVLLLAALMFLFALDWALEKAFRRKVSSQ